MDVADDDLMMDVGDNDLMPPLLPDFIILDYVDADVEDSTSSFNSRKKNEASQANLKRTGRTVFLCVRRPVDDI